MNSEMNTGETGDSGIGALGGSGLPPINLEHGSAEQISPYRFSPGDGNPEHIALDSQAAHAMRQCLHELANVFTGIMVGADLLALRLAEGSLHQYAEDICASGERGCTLVRELRSRLLAASGEIEAAPPGRGPG
jgi:hypothetical protein